MSCKELILLIRTNKGKSIVYVLFGAVITFILCSVLYLLITVNNIEFNVTEQLISPEQIDSYTISDALSNGVELQDNNFTKTLNGETNLTANIEMLMVKFSKYKEEFSKYKEETSKNLTVIQLDYKKEFSKYKEEFSKYKEETSKNLTVIQLDYKEEFVDNLTVIASRVTDNKKEFIGLIKNLTNIVVSLRLRHLGDKVEVKHNLTFISSQINNVTRNFEGGVDRLYILVKSNNKTIHNVLSEAFAYIEKYKNDLGKNITKLRTSMKENEAFFGKKINSSLEGSQLFWEKCPIYWKDVGGVYPVKVCEYK